MAYTQVIDPRKTNIPEGYFDNDNVEFIRQKASELLYEFNQKIVFDRASVIRVMQRILEERREPVPSMNRRVIMSLCNEFRNYQHEVNRNLKWLENYTLSQKAYDPTVERRVYPPLHLRNRLGRPLVGGTLKFNFIS